MTARCYKTLGVCLKRPQQLPRKKQKRRQLKTQEALAQQNQQKEPRVSPREAHPQAKKRRVRQEDIQQAGNKWSSLIILLLWLSSLNKEAIHQRKLHLEAFEYYVHFFLIYKMHSERYKFNA